MKQVWGHGKPSFLVKQETVRNVSETIINVQQLLAHRWKNTDKSAQLKNALNAHVAQVVEAMVLETIQWKFESFHEHQVLLLCSVTVSTGDFESPSESSNLSTTTILTSEEYIMTDGYGLS